MRLLAERKDSLERLEQTDSDARRQNGHGEATFPCHSLWDDRGRRGPQSALRLLPPLFL